MKLPNLDDQLRSLKSKVDVPEGLSDRIIASVSNKALKRQRRRLAFEYLAHGFASVIVAFFIIRIVAPQFDNFSLVIAAALVVAMFWLLFKVSGVQTRKHFGRLAFSSASFGFVLAALGLFSFSNIDTLNTTANETMIVEESVSDFLDFSSTTNVLDAMESTKSTDEFAGNGQFGNIISIIEGSEYYMVKMVMDSGEEANLPILKELFEARGFEELAESDRIYLEGNFIVPVDEDESLIEFNQNWNGGNYTES
jgi:hypothetical protein